MLENWVPVNIGGGYPDYTVSDLGGIRRNGKDLEFRACFIPGDRVTVSLYRDDQRIVYQLSHVVLTAFKGPRPPGMLCCHNDGNSINNAVSNLRWDTSTANALDTVKHGRSRRGKLNDEQVRYIRSRPEKIIVLAGKFGLSASAINNIQNGYTYRSVRHADNQC